MKTTSIGNLNMKNTKMIRTLLAAVALALPAAAPATTLAPDAGNYSATDQTPFSFVDISGAGGGTSVLAGVDDSAVALTLPFSFNFYGTAYTQVCVSSNGALYFVTDAATCSTTTGDFAHIDLNAGAPAPDLPAVYAFWTDLTFQDTGAGSVFYQTLGTAGSRRFIVQWNTALPQGDTSGVTFEAILTEGTNAITLQYQTVSLGAGDNNRNGRLATVGIHNANGFAQSKQQQWSYNAAVLTDGTALQFQAAAPSAPALSSPANGATGVGAPVSLTWNTTIGASTYDVYFGTTATPPLVQADVTATNYSAATTAGATYYWKIVAKNGAGNAESPVFSFTTAVAAPGAPSLTAPANGASGITAPVSLTWNSAIGATSYDVYFGTTSTPPLVQADTTSTNYSATTAAGTTYFWKIAAKNTTGTTNSAVFSFTTAVAVPGAPSLSSPANAATGVASPVSLTWNAVTGATAYDIYFGTASTPPLVQADATSTNYSATTAAGTTYFWKIAAKNASGSTNSPVFSFTTAAASGGSGGGGSGGGGGGGGGGAAPITLSPATVTLNAAVGTTAATQTVTLSYQTFTQGAPSFLTSVNTNQGQGWLTVTPASGTMTQTSLVGGSYTYSVTLTVKGDPTGIADGSTYTGRINVTAAGAIASLPVTMKVATPPALTLAPTQVTLNAAVGTTVATQAVTLSYQTSTEGAPSFQTTASTNQGQGWLTVTPTSGTMTQASHVGTVYTYTATLTVKGDPTGISDGSTYTGKIDFTVAGTTASLPVTMKVAAPAALTLAPAQMTLNAATGTTAVTQTVTASYQTSTEGAPPFVASASTSQGQGWLSVTPASGTMTQTSHVDSLYTYSATFTVQGDPTGIADGTTYTGAINLTVAGTMGSLPVTMNVAKAAPLPQPTGGIANAASGGQATPSVVTPGSYVAIYGTDMADSGDPNAKTLPLPTTLNGAQVTLCGVPVPLLYASATQINILLPQTLPSTTTCPLVVTKGTVASAAVTLTVAPLQPGIYTANTSGSGPGIVTNAATAQLNDADHPAHASDFLVIYMTGLGQVVGPDGEAGPADGAAAPSDKLFHTVANVTATIGGVPTPVSFSGLTPTLAGLYQVNVQLPQGVTPGSAVPVVVTATNQDTGATAQSNTVTIVVQ